MREVQELIEQLEENLAFSVAGRNRDRDRERDRDSDGMVPGAMASDEQITNEFSF